MAVETMTQEEYYAMGKVCQLLRFPKLQCDQRSTQDKPLPDDGPTFALLAILLSVAMWAYEGGWVNLTRSILAKKIFDIWASVKQVAGALGKAWSGFPTLLTALQLGAG
mmetsp:Transcript_2155/g.4298  ORF Transcript_2155/g.4298 Transcript_2155/m.4298 type:complete len:109 (-) Transcript_2155:267-593(-)